MPLAKNATILMSGGIDSASCAHFLSAQGYNVRGVFVDFGQPSGARERVAVAALAEHLGIQVITISASAATNFQAGELIGRNAFLVFSAILLGHCNSGIVVLGIHSGTSYYDCSNAFIERIDPLVKECTNGAVVVSAPFVSWSKDDIYSYFLSTDIPLSITYSCEAGSTPPCGVCASCKDRARIEC